MRNSSAIHIPTSKEDVRGLAGSSFPAQPYVLLDYHFHFAKLLGPAEQVEQCLAQCLAPVTRDHQITSVRALCSSTHSFTHPSPQWDSHTYPLNLPYSLTGLWACMSLISMEIQSGTKLHRVSDFTSPTPSSTVQRCAGHSGEAPEVFCGELMSSSL